MAFSYSVPLHPGVPGGPLKTGNPVIKTDKQDHIFTHIFVYEVSYIQILV